MVQSPRERHDAAITHATIRRLESDDSAIAGWAANRAGGIRSQRTKAKARGCRSGGASRRSTRNAIQRPGIVNGPEVADGRRSTVGEFMKIGLAQYNRAGVLQSPHHLSIFGRNPIFKQFTRRGGANARGVDIVLQRDRDTV